MGMVRIIWDEIWRFASYAPLAAKISVPLWIQVEFPRQSESGEFSHIAEEKEFQSGWNNHFI